MKAWNTQAADKKGDDRKAFMSECLKAGAPAAPMTQQDKMKVCNTKAGDKKGDERKTFMRVCEGGQEVLADSRSSGVRSPRLAVPPPGPSLHGRSGGGSLWT